MYRELAICIIIIVVIFAFDFVLQKYTDDAIGEITSRFEEIKNEIISDKFDYDEVEKKTGDLYIKWEEYNDKFAYFIEHTELEKVETAFISYKSYLRSKQYHDAIAELEKTTFILNHINEKYSFSLENMF